MNKLPPELDPRLLSTLPTMVVGVGFDCPVQIPMTRSSGRSGMTISVAETATGPVMVIGIAHPNGTALAGVIDGAAFPGFLELLARQSTRLRDMLAPPAAPPETKS